MSHGKNTYVVIFGILLLASVELSGCGDQEADAGSIPAAQPSKPSPTAGISSPDPAAGSTAKTPRRNHQPAPEFSLPTIDGGTLGLAELKGKVVLLDFWATWCGPCRAGIPHLNTLYAEYKDHGLEVVGISVDQNRGSKTGADLVRDFSKRIRMDYPLVMCDLATQRAYGGIRSIPTAFLIDREGKIRRRYVGLQQKYVFEKDVKELLAESTTDDGTI